MAIGNPFNGQLKGRIGDTVFSRSQGRQLSRAHVPAPNNPKSTSQMGQRVKFATCAAFYSHAIKNGFKFAYEDKREGESDYNAFMRHNLSCVTPQTKYAIDNDHPCPGVWRMSYGTLPMANIEWDDQIAQGYLCAVLKVNSFTYSGDAPTVADFSKALISTYRLKDGDFVTVLQVTSPDTLFKALDAMMRERSIVDHSSDSTVTWTVEQFMIDSTNTEEITDEFPFEAVSSGSPTLPTHMMIDENYDSIACCAVIFSRVTKDGVKVSSAQLLCNPEVVDALTEADLPEWWEFCADTFNESTSLANDPEDILKGSQSYN